MEEGLAKAHRDDTKNAETLSKARLKAEIRAMG